MKQIPKSFYTSDDVVFIAKELLGKVLISKIDNKIIQTRIVETEAYRGPDDKASHTYNNRKNNKNQVMYEEGGNAYVYISYGMHHMLNIVTSSEGSGHAVLIRAVEPIIGVDIIKLNRGVDKDNFILTGGPGKVCQALKITKEMNMQKFYKKDALLQIWDDGILPEEIVNTPRVGMSQHTDFAANWPWRFYIKGNKYVSRPLTLVYNY